MTYVAAATGAPTAALASEAAAAGSCILPGIDGCPATKTQLNPVQTDTTFLVDIANS